MLQTQKGHLRLFREVSRRYRVAHARTVAGSHARGGGEHCLRMRAFSAQHTERKCVKIATYKRECIQSLAAKFCDVQVKSR